MQTARREGKEKEIDGSVGRRFAVYVITGDYKLREYAILLS